MQNPERVIRQLSNLGLTSYEAKAYVGLVGRDSFTAAQVARYAGLPRQRIYDVLGSLIEKGLASARPGRVVKYAAAAPEVAIGRLVDAHRSRIVDLEQEAAEAVSELGPVYQAGLEHTDPLEYIEVLRDRGAINERFRELEAAVKHEILVFTKPPYATPPQENTEGLKVARTHHARSIYEYNIFDDPVAADAVRHFIEAGEEARVVESLPLKLVIIDETIVMFGMQDPVEPRGSDLTIMVVEHPSLAKVLKVAFDAVWQSGLTFQEAYDRMVRQRQKPA